MMAKTPTVSAKKSTSVARKAVKKAAKKSIGKKSAQSQAAGKATKSSSARTPSKPRTYVTTRQLLGEAENTLDRKFHSGLAALNDRLDRELKDIRQGWEDFLDTPDYADELSVEVDVLKDIAKVQNSVFESMSNILHMYEARITVLETTPQPTLGDLFEDFFARTFSSVYDALHDFFVGADPEEYDLNSELPLATPIGDEDAQADEEADEENQGEGTILTTDVSDLLTFFANFTDAYGEQIFPLDSEISEATKAGVLTLFSLEMLSLHGLRKLPKDNSEFLSIPVSFVEEEIAKVTAFQQAVADHIEVSRITGTEIDLEEWNASSDAYAFRLSAMKGFAAFLKDHPKNEMRVRLVDGEIPAAEATEALLPLIGEELFATVKMILLLDTEQLLALAVCNEIPRSATVDGFGVYTLFDHRNTTAHEVEFAENEDGTVKATIQGSAIPAITSPTLAEARVAVEANIHSMGDTPSSSTEEATDADQQNAAE
jgi:hypothetical protein